MLQWSTSSSINGELTLLPPLNIFNLTSLLDAKIKIRELDASKRVAQSGSKLKQLD